MDYEKLKKELKDIAEVASSVPEAFRERCFEVLLEHLLSDSSEAKSIPLAKDVKGKKRDELLDDPGKPAGQSIPTPAKVRVFMKRTGVTEEHLQALFLYEDDELHFIKEPAAEVVSTGQIEWALLIALKNGILGNSMGCDAESVRSICQEKGYYDKKNFSTNFKKAAHSKLFSAPLETQGEAQTLSNDGLDALGKVVKSLVGSDL
ncbi:hypothetical protein [Teredinibacter turnerae]|uniref:hypothetical protein n=1 Tax=Teredinibacter turnerae TaxID=2426 RepID=UPI000364A900|nr:hypothetical protein [Teredinibacter turnerae]